MAEPKTLAEFHDDWMLAKKAAASLSIDFRTIDAVRLREKEAKRRYSQELARQS